MKALVSSAPGWPRSAAAYFCRPATKKLLWLTRSWSISSRSAAAAASFGLRPSLCCGWRTRVPDPRCPAALKREIRGTPLFQKGEGADIVSSRQKHVCPQYRERVSLPVLVDRIEMPPPPVHSSCIVGAMFIYYGNAQPGAPSCRDWQTSSINLPTRFDVIMALAKDGRSAQPQTVLLQLNHLWVNHGEGAVKAWRINRGRGIMEESMQRKPLWRNGADRGGGISEAEEPGGTQGMGRSREG